MAKTTNKIGNPHIFIFNSISQKTQFTKLQKNTLFKIKKAPNNILKPTRLIQTKVMFSKAGLKQIFQPES